MKLLFDQNLSYKLVKQLTHLYPSANHVCLLNLDTSDDQVVWQFAKDNDFIIVSQESDFNDKSVLYGFPPKILWIRTGNVATRNIKRLLEEKFEEITLFYEDRLLGLYELY